MTVLARLRRLLTAWPGFIQPPFGRPRWPSFATGFAKKETRG